jgi:toxin ParE1/3/4
LASIWRYLAVEASAAVADRTVQTVRQHCDLLSSQPAMGRLRPDIARDIRASLSAGYLVLYRSTQTEVEIARVLHGSRDIAAAFQDADGD